ncbi:MAG: M48 family metallopeptidase, partial [Candidatus Omnitrophica bacterium]|nr:M48 family metallopeptidase [Candidatus Omnitrophota bacterium]
KQINTDIYVISCAFLQFRKYKTFQTAENSFPRNARSYDDRREAFSCYARLMGSWPRKIAVRTQKRIWGSCSKSQQRINLNWCLIMASLPVIDYVVVHELCHLGVANHSGRFWKKSEKIFPDHKIRKKWLRSRAGDMVMP